MYLTRETPIVCVDEFGEGNAACWHPDVKGYTPMINSIYNGLRMEDVWLDR